MNELFELKQDIDTEFAELLTAGDRKAMVRNLTDIVQNLTSITQRLVDLFDDTFFEQSVE